MKPRSKNTIEKGFTLIELIVVIAIMGLMSTLVVVNFNKQRALRSVIQAENEMVTQIRKAQSYILSGRNPQTNVAAKYYLLTFTKNTSSYTIETINASNAFSTVETVKLNEGAIISDLSINGGASHPNCFQVIFSSPYGKMYIYDASTCNSGIASILIDPLQSTTLANKSAQITISNPKTTTTKTVTTYGITGRIEGN